MNELLRVILTRADVPEASVFSADEVVRWPPGALDLLLRSGLLRETAPANGLVCDQCEEACWIEPDIREDPQTGKKIGVFFCTRREDIGHFTVDLERLRQWEAHLSGLSAHAHSRIHSPTWDKPCWPSWLATAYRAPSP